MGATLLLGCLGCTTFQPATLESVPLGATVRARLDREGEARVLDLTRRQTSSLDGTLVARDARTVVLEVWRADLSLSPGPAFDPGRLRVPLPATSIVDVERKQISILRTGGLATAIAGGLVLLARAVWSGVGGGSGGGSGGHEI